MSLTINLRQGISMADFYVYGKLKARRDFVQSSSLPRAEIDYWSAWFDACTISTAVPGFLSKHKNLGAIWVFLICDQKRIRLGVATLSHDSSGRRYPFLVYQILHEDQANGFCDKEFCRIIRYMYVILNNSITAGDYINGTDVDREAIDRILIEHDFDLWANQRSILFNNAGNDVIFSIWISLQDQSVLENNGALNCALYNKIFG